MTVTAASLLFIISLSSFLWNTAHLLLFLAQSHTVTPPPGSAELSVSPYRDELSLPQITTGAYNILKQSVMYPKTWDSVHQLNQILYLRDYQQLLYRRYFHETKMNLGKHKGKILQKRAVT